jgi:hypothetical protein
MKIPVYFVLYAVIMIGFPILIIVLSTVLKNDPIGTNSLFLIIVSMFGGFMSLPKSFKNIDYRNIKLAYLVLKQSRKIWLVMSIIMLTIYPLIFLDARGLPIGTYFDIHPELGFVPITMITSLFYLAISAMVLGIWNKSSDFLFFMARETIKVASNKQDTLEKVGELFDCLTWYFRYIRLIFDKNIASTDRIVSKILTQSNTERAKSLNSFYKAFVDGDELEPLNVVDSLLVETSGTELLVSRNLMTRFKELAVPIGIILGVITALVNLWNTFILPNLP